MKMEAVQAELQSWGELIITTSTGRVYEIHLGDTEFDLKARVIRLQAASSLHVIDGDSIEAIEKHYGHAVE